MTPSFGQLTFWVSMLCLTLVAGCAPATGDQAMALSDPTWDIYPATAHPRPNDPFILTLKGSFGVSDTIIEPPYPNLITQMIVRDYTRTLETYDGQQHLEVKLEVEAEMEGVYEVPPIPVIFDGPAGVVRRATLPLFLQVGLEAAKGVTDIRDLKPLRRRPLSAGFWWTFTLFGFALALSALFLFWWKRTQRPVDPYRAFEEQIATAASIPVFGKEQAFLLSQAIRTVLAQTTPVPAEAHTVQELEAMLPSLALQPNVREQILMLLRLCSRLDDIKYRPEFTTASSGIPHSPNEATIWYQEAMKGVTALRTSMERAKNEQDERSKDSGAAVR